jgi:hypothetical protein
VISRNCGIELGTRSCQLTLDVPGVNEAEIQVESNGSASVELTIYDGQSAADAVAAYSRFRGALRVIYPALAFQESSIGTDRDRLTISPAPTAKLTLLRRLAPREGIG